MFKEVDQVNVVFMNGIFTLKLSKYNEQTRVDDTEFFSIKTNKVFIGDFEVNGAK